MKGQILKKSEILIRLKEIFDITKLDAKLTQEQADLIECNMQIVKYFVELQECRDFTEVGRLGFGEDEDLEGDDFEGDEEAGEDPQKINSGD